MDTHTSDSVEKIQHSNLTLTRHEKRKKEKRKESKKRSTVQWIILASLKQRTPLSEKKKYPIQAIIVDIYLCIHFCSLPLPLEAQQYVKCDMK